VVGIELLSTKNAELDSHLLTFINNTKERINKNLQSLADMATDRLIEYILSKVSETPFYPHLEAQLRGENITRLIGEMILKKPIIEEKDLHRLGDLISSQIRCNNIENTKITENIQNHPIFGKEKWYKNDNKKGAIVAKLSEMILTTNKVSNKDYKKIGEIVDSALAKVEDPEEYKVIPRLSSYRKKRLSNPEQKELLILFTKSIIFRDVNEIINKISENISKALTLNGEKEISAHLRNNFNYPPRFANSFEAAITKLSENIAAINLAAKNEYEIVENDKRAKRYVDQVINKIMDSRIENELTYKNMKKWLEDEYSEFLHAAFKDDSTLIPDKVSNDIIAILNKFSPNPETLKQNFDEKSIKEAISNISWINTPEPELRVQFETMFITQIETARNNMLKKRNTLEKLHEDTERLVKDTVYQWGRTVIDESKNNPLLIQPIQEWAKEEVDPDPSVSASRDALFNGNHVKPKDSKELNELNIVGTQIKRVIVDAKEAKPMSEQGACIGKLDEPHSKAYLTAGNVANCEIVDVESKANGCTFRESLVGDFLKVVPGKMPDAKNTLAMMQYVDAMLKPFLSKPGSLDRPKVIRGHNNVDYIRAVMLLYTAYGINFHYEKCRLRSDVLANYKPDRNSPEVLEVKEMIKKGLLKPLSMPEISELLEGEYTKLKAEKEKIKHWQPIADQLGMKDANKALIESIAKAQKLITQTREDKLTPQIVEESAFLLKPKQR
jgi:hypothetical protein